MGNEVETPCRVCGLDDGEARFDERGLALFVICACCGTESGIGDDAPHRVRHLRRRWLDAGAAWCEPRARPAGWTPERQLADVPLRWR